MLTGNFFTFLIISVLGVLVTFFGIKNKGEYRRYIITIGVTTMHVGIFGILYEKLSFVPFLTLVLLVLSTFVLIDPLKISKHLPGKSFRISGLFLLIAALAFALMHITGFPIWLWIFPFVVYVVPFTIPSWRAKHLWFQALAWLLVLLYSSIIGYHVYSLYHPENQVESLETLFKPLSNKDELQNKFRFLQNSSVKKVDIENTIQQAQNETAETEKLTETPPLMTNPLQKDKPALHPESQTSSPLTPLSIAEPKEIEIETEDSEKGPLYQAVQDFDQKYLELKRDYRKLQEKYRNALQEIDELKDQMDQKKDESSQEL